MLLDLIKKNRSYRRFHQNHAIEKTDLLAFIDLARLSASARNQQSLKYFVSNKEPLNTIIFECLAWAGYIKDWDGPADGEQPAAYIVIINDNTIASNHFCDEGIAAQSILLGAVEKGFGGCIIAAVNKPKLAKAINLTANFEILLVIALGKPLEEIIIEEVINNDYKYWRDENQIHHVPKRKLHDLIINL